MDSYDPFSKVKFFTDGYFRYSFDKLSHFKSNSTFCNLNSLLLAFIQQICTDCLIYPANTLLGSVEQHRQSSYLRAYKLAERLDIEQGNKIYIYMYIYIYIKINAYYKNCGEVNKKGTGARRKTLRGVLTMDLTTQNGLSGKETL